MDNRTGRQVKKSGRVERALRRVMKRDQARRKARAGDSARLDWIEEERADVKPFYNGWHVRVGNAHGQSDGPKATAREAVDRARAALRASNAAHRRAP